MKHALIHELYHFFINELNNVFYTPHESFLTAIPWFVYSRKAVVTNYLCFPMGIRRQIRQSQFENPHKIQITINRISVNFPTKCKPNARAIRMLIQGAKGLER